MNQAAGRPLGSLLEEQPNGRDPLGAGEAIFFPTRRCANAESATADRIAQARLAQIHSERAEINRFAIVEAHGCKFLALSFKDCRSEISKSLTMKE